MSEKEHPALKSFNTTWEAVKHIGGKALKWAAYGAIALAALSFIIPIAPTAGILGSIVSVFTGGAQGATWTAAVLTKAMTMGAVAGGMMGAASGVGSLGGALDERKQDCIADYEQAAVSRQRAAFMQQRSQSVGGGGSVAPGAGLGRTTQQQGLGI